MYNGGAAPYPEKTVWSALVVKVSLVLRAVRRRRYPLLGTVILALVTAAPVGIAGNEDPVTPVAVASTDRVEEPVVLQGTAEPVPATPLTGITTGSVVEWLVKDGSVVQEGDALYREAKPGVFGLLGDLRLQEQAAVQELKNALEAPPPDFRAEQEYAARVAQWHGEAVSRFEAADSEGAAAIRTAEATLLRLRAFGDPEDALAYGAALEAGKLDHERRMNELGEAVSEATRLMDDANAALAWRRFEAQRRMAELHLAPAVLAAQIRKLESGIAHGKAPHGGVIRIRANRVPQGAQEAERVVGELQAPGFVLVAPAGSAPPELIVGASVHIGGSEFACEETELVPETSTVRCLIPGVETVAPGAKGELRLAAGGE